jgi:hemin uptake protein HemP
LTSEELLRGAEEVLIEHETSTYRLRRTHQGKLILTK